MPIDNQLFRARVGLIYSTDLYFLKKTPNVPQNSKCFYVTHPKVLSYLMLVLLYLVVVNMYLLSLKIGLSSSIMVAKSFNSRIVLCNYIATICISIASIMTTELLLKSGDTEINPGPKKSSAIKFCRGNLK